MLFAGMDGDVKNDGKFVTDWITLALDFDKDFLFKLVNKHTCTHTHIYTHTHTDTHTHTHACAYIHTHTCMPLTHVHVLTHTLTQTYTHTSLCTYTSACAPACTHGNIYLCQC